MNHSAHTRPRIAWFSAFTERLRSASFSRTMLPVLADYFDISLLVSDEDANLFAERSGATLGLESLPIHHYLQCRYLHRSRPFDAFVYLIEDSPHCAFVERHLRLAPGITLFFDLNLHRLVLSRYRHSTGGTDVNEELRRAHGPSAVPLGDYLVRGWPAEIFERLYPLGLDLSGSAEICVTESPSISRALRSSGRNTEEMLLTPVSSVPEACVRAERGMLRRMLELDDNRYIVGFSGGTGPAERLPQILDAIVCLGSKAPLLLWLVRTQEEERAAVAVLARIPEAAVNTRVQRSDEQAEFAGLHSVPDVWLYPQCDLLRGAPLGFTDSIARRIPLIVSEIGFSEMLPERSVLRIPPGFDEPVFLACALSALSDKAAREAFSRGLEEPLAARSPSQSAAAFTDLFNRNAEALAAVRKTLDYGQAAARSALLASRAAANAAAAPLIERAALDFGWRTGVL